MISVRSSLWLWAKVCTARRRYQRWETLWNLNGWSHIICKKKTSEWHQIPFIAITSNTKGNSHPPNSFQQHLFSLRRHGFGGMAKPGGPGLDAFEGRPGEGQGRPTDRAGGGAAVPGGVEIHRATAAVAWRGWLVGCCFSERPRKGIRNTMMLLKSLGVYICWFQLFGEKLDEFAVLVEDLFESWLWHGGLRLDRQIVLTAIATEPRQEKGWNHQWFETTSFAWWISRHFLARCVGKKSTNRLFVNVL